MKDKLNHSKLCEKANQEWRNPLQIINFEGCFNPAKSQLLKYIVCGDWWDIIHRLNIRLLVSREYEHLLICLSCDSDSPRISFMTIPHPSGIAVDQDKKAIYVASTRNPNMIYQFNPINGFTERRDNNKFKEVSTAGEKTLIPVRVFFLPGSLYIHDMISMNKNLYASAVGHNSIIQISDNGEYKYVWWPKCVDKENKPDIQDNYIQLNSIAGNKTIADSYFTSSTEKILSTRPGDIDFPVIKKGVLFNGKTKEVVCRGLTRPHSARMNKGKVWLNNSGYGEFGFVKKNKFFKLLKLPGWTRGLYFKDNIAFVGTSKVNPRFSNYAPGIDLKSDICAVHAIDIKTGRIIGSIEWPSGNQIFAIEGINKDSFGELPMSLLPGKTPDSLNHLFYAFKNNRA